MANLLTQFRSLIPRTPVLVGDIVARTGAECLIELDNGARYTARDTTGELANGTRVYFRPGGAIEGEAPQLATVEILI